MTVPPHEGQRGLEGRPPPPAYAAWNQPGQAQRDQPQRVQRAAGPPDPFYRDWPGGVRPDGALGAGPIPATSSFGPHAEAAEASRLGPSTASYGQTDQPQTFGNTYALPDYRIPPSGIGRPPLDQPWYDIGPFNALIRGFQKYGTYTGRASPREFWWFYLWNAGLTAAFFVGFIFTSDWLAFGDAIEADHAEVGVIGLLTHLQDLKLGGLFVVLLLVWSLGSWTPLTMVSWRRLHDAGHSITAYHSAGIIPVVGPLMFVSYLSAPPSPQGDFYDQLDQARLSSDANRRARLKEMGPATRRFYS
ncbi:MAG: DUF805 domain-containing protein [Bifidobacteriaceae bacterium]|jgi:uncharacterized membrane protein YhaH (DUF805 family)|nr:DUF805 domain-containing protein [Bifidobacteriaceae bacterium]